MPPCSTWRSDEFIALGLIELTYGLALLTVTYGFLAVFAAGLALRCIDEPATVSTPAPIVELSAEDQLATGSHAPAHMMRQVERFNSQLESFAEVAIVLVVASVIAHGISVTPMMKRYETRKKQ